MISWQEKDIEDALWARSNIDFGWTIITEWVGRQVKVPSGIIDLLGVTRGELSVVVEIKNVAPQSDHLTQVCRYAADVAMITESPPDLVTKILCFPSCQVDTKVVFEADALNVWLVPIIINLGVDVCGPVGWSKKHRDELHESYLIIQDSEPFAKLRGLIRADEIIEDISKDYEDEQSPPNIE